MGMGPGEANDFLYDNGLGVMAKLATSYIVGPSRRPRHPLVGQLAADADRLPDIEHLLLLADGFRATSVPLAPAVEDKDGHAPTRQQERGGRAQPARSR